MVQSSGSHPYYHSPSDTAENIQEENLDVTARMIWAAIRPLAMGDEDPHYSESAAAAAPSPRRAAVREVELRSSLR